MPFVGIGVDDLDLAILDIAKTVGGLARPGQEGAGRIGLDGARGAQRIHMRRRQWRALHLAQIGAYRFHYAICLCVIRNEGLVRNVSWRSAVSSNIFGAIPPT